MNLIGAVEEFNKNCFSDPLKTLLNNYVGSYDLECDIHVSEIFLCWIPHRFWKNNRLWQLMKDGSFALRSY